MIAPVINAVLDAARTAAPDNPVHALGGVVEAAAMMTAGVIGLAREKGQDRYYEVIGRVTSRIVSAVETFFKDRAQGGET